MAILRRVSTLLLAAGLLAVGTHPTGTADAGLQTMQPGVLAVCLYPGFAPFSSRNAEGRFVGWDVDYLSAFATAHGLRLQTVEVGEYSGIWNQPARGTCDVAASGISDTPDRRASSDPRAAWTRHYYSVLRAFLVRSADADRLKSIDDLRGRTVIVTSDSTADHDLRNRLARNGITTTIVEVTSDERDAALRVRDAADGGEPFAYGGGLGSVNFLAAELGGLSVAWPHCTMLADGSETQEPFSFVVRAADVGLRQALDGFIAAPATPYGGVSNTDENCSPVDEP